MNDSLYISSDLRLLDRFQVQALIRTLRHEIVHWVDTLTSVQLKISKA